MLWGFFRFVDDPEYIEARDGTGILDGLMLRVVEVSRCCHHNILYYMTQVGLSSLLHEEVDEILIADHLGSIFVMVEGSLCSSGRALLVGFVSAPHTFVVGPLLW